VEPPAQTEQIRFLTNIQRLLAEGLFTATYKYALIAALADLSVEKGDDSGNQLLMSTFVIAEKFVEYYWRHAIPYATTNGQRILRQNTDQLPCDLPCTNRIARWAYEQTENARGLTWLRGDDLFPLSAEWRSHLSA